MTLEALRQELLNEERMPAWIQVIMKQFCDMGTTLPRPPPNNNCRRRVQPSPPGAMPPGLLWTSDPVRDRNTDRLLSLYMGFSPCAVKIFCDEQYGPETDADRVQRLKSDADPARFLIFKLCLFPRTAHKVGRIFRLTLSRHAKWLASIFSVGLLLRQAKKE